MPLNGGQSSSRLGFHCFSSLLVGVRLRKSISPVAVERRSVLLVDGYSPSPSMLFSVRLRKLIFPVAVSMWILILEVEL